MRLLDRLREGDDETDDGCGCDPAVRSPRGNDPDRSGTLVVAADGCPARGDLVASPDCRATVVDALAGSGVDAVHVRAGGRERVYDDGAVGLLVAAGRFAARVAVHDERLAERARRDPLGAARAATGRAGPASTLAASTGLAAGADRVDGYEAAFGARTGPTVADTRLDRCPPRDATLVARRELGTGATVRRYRTEASDRYLLDPPGWRLDAAELTTLADAYDRLADTTTGDDAAAVSRAVRTVAPADGSMSVATVERVLRRHTRGHGVLEDLFADPRVSEVLVTAPVTDNPVRVAVDGERVPTNVHLTRRGAEALASRFRRESGRAFSRAAPTLDATTRTRNGRVRVAGVADPASDGYAFVFRTGGREAWTLPALVANGTLPVDAAALCSVAVERAGAGLIAGPRGAGKTTLLSALLWELPPSTRAVVVEDTPELPAARLQEAGRDVQTVRVESGDGPALSPTEALRTALRLGEGALVVGEVRGEEAATLYEAMRVGAASSAVLGTIHGDGADAVFERVVSDLEVPASSFGATDFLVTLSAGERRTVSSVEEVRDTGDGVAFESLFEPVGDGTEATGVVDRGNSRLVASLARPGESYADVLGVIDERASLLANLAGTERTDPAAVDAVHRERVAE
ncbi:type II secretion protein [Haloplanus rallus]|jgi:type IV secretory pathway ATPase VirB11/archaellum biosynthesis ATPase|uniref:Type II secretion protein n=1 Tax=Haloplanus rallus TaxID=1816183 RepID=A0A6B9FDQ2_9EURY|nr:MULTISPECIES: ATPase, T2SS/T4P/T4SS family [Haloplanus]QGX94690.1 type II secretion protein [Haloplanus rallus]